MTTAAQLVKRSYYLAQVLDPREEIEGFQATEGLAELNRSIDLWGALAMYIPSYSELTISILAGVSSYDQTPVITQLASGHIIDANDVQNPVIPIDLQRFNTLNYALSNTSRMRPTMVFPDNQFANFPTKTAIRVYPVPDTTYTMTLYAMLRLANVTESQDLTHVPPHWIAAMEMELSKRLINIYGTEPAVTWPEDYKSVMDILKAGNKRDRSVKVMNEFRSYRRFKTWSVYVD